MEDNARRKRWPKPAFCRLLEAFEVNLKRTFTKFSSICMLRSVCTKSAYEFCISFGSTASWLLLLSSTLRLVFYTVKGRWKEKYKLTHMLS